MRPAPMSEALWAALRAAPDGLTRHQLWLVAGSTPRTVGHRLQLWRAAGLVELHGRDARDASGRRTPRWRLVHGAPATPPALTARGNVQRRDLVSARLWRAARLLRRFDVASLAMSAEISQRSAVRWLYKLRAVGLARGAGGRPGDSWTLVRDLGPVPPSIVWSPGGWRCIAVERLAA